MEAPRFIEKLKGIHHDARNQRLKEQQDRRVSGALVKETKHNAFLGVLPTANDAGTSAVVATVALSNFQLRNVASKAKYQTYLRIGVENCRETTERIEDISMNPKFQETFTLGVTDIFSDIAVSCYGKAGKAAALFGDHYLGKVCIPLSRLFKGKSGLKLCSRTDNRYVLESWFTIYPLKESKVHYEPVVEGLPGTGMHRGDPLGDLHCCITLEITENMSVFGAMLLNPPFKPSGEFELDEFDAKELRYGALRLKKLVQSNKTFLNNLASLTSWSVPSVSLVVLCWWTFLCWFSNFIQVPFLVASLVVYLNWAFPHRDDDVAPMIWNDEIELDPNMPQTIVQKLKLLSKLLKVLQQTFNSVAFKTERVAATVSWTDTPIAAMFSLIYLLIGLAGSCLLGVLYFVQVHFMPLYALVYILGVSLFLPINISGKVSAAKSSQKSDTSMIVKAMKNLFARLPDEKELVHRRIAKSQEKLY